MTSLVAGFVLGLAGSGHCVGMCGPLVLTLGRSAGRASRRARLQYSACYHGGRVLTYAALAVPAGMAGEALALRGFGGAVTIVMAVLLLAHAASAAHIRWLRPAARLTSATARRVCDLAARWRVAHPLAGPIVAGSANGLLPCGLVYAAVMTAATMGTTSDAVLLMLGFGLGTLPVLVALSISAASVPLRWRVKVRHLTPVVLALTAALMLVRGLVKPSEQHRHHGSITVAVDRIGTR